MRYINRRNEYSNVMILAVLPTVVQTWISLYLDTIWGEKGGFLAVCSVITLAIQYYNYLDR